MATASISPDDDVIDAEIFIAAPPERVFQALTDPEQMPKWWGQQGTYWVGPSNTAVRWELEPRAVHALQSRGPQKVGTGTVVKIRHSGFARNLPSAKDHRDGWVRILGWMQAFVEKGETADTRSQRNRRCVPHVSCFSKRGNITALVAGRLMSDCSRRFTAWSRQSPRCSNSCPGCAHRVAPDRQNPGLWKSPKPRAAVN